MTDIVERLRDRARAAREEHTGTADGDVVHFEEAAAEIERLREELSGALCPGGGYTGQPPDELRDVAACLKAGVCGCSLGAAISHPNQADAK